MNRYRTREVTVGRFVKQQTRYYPQYQPEGDSFSWFNFSQGGADIYFTSLAEAEAFLDVNVEEEVISNSSSDLSKIFFLSLHLQMWARRFPTVLVLKSP